MLLALPHESNIDMKLNTDLSQTMKRDKYVETIYMADVKPPILPWTPLNRFLTT